jgi:hypothetical protein
MLTTFTFIYMYLQFVSLPTGRSWIVRPGSLFSENEIHYTVISVTEWKV